MKRQALSVQEIFNGTGSREIESTGAEGKRHRIRFGAFEDGGQCTQLAVDFKIVAAYRTVTLDVAVRGITDTRSILLLYPYALERAWPIHIAIWDWKSGRDRVSRWFKTRCPYWLDSARD